MKSKNGVTLISFSELRDETGCTHTTLHKYLSRAKIRASKTIKVGNGVLRYYDPAKLVAFKRQLKDGALKQAVGRPRKEATPAPVLDDVVRPFSLTELDQLRAFLNPLPEMEIILMRYQNFTDKRIVRMQESLDHLNRSIDAHFRGDSPEPRSYLEYADFFDAAKATPDANIHRRNTVGAPSLAPMVR